MLNFDTPEVFAVALKFVRRRCPHLNEEELQEAASAWIGYMKVVWRIHERVEAEENTPTTRRCSFRRSVASLPLKALPAVDRC
jgi:hypothetical protein